MGGLKYGSLSLHPGGIHAAMVDGSIHFISENIEKTLYIQLGHMADGLPPEPSPASNVRARRSTVRNHAPQNAEIP